MNYSNRCQYKKSLQTRIEAEAIALYARGKSPYVGIPIVEDGTRRPAVFIRKHLVAAMESKVVTAIYDAETHSLTLNGGKSKYVLRDLTACGSRQVWTVKDELQKWALSKRKIVAVKKLPANLRADAKRRQEVEKPGRKLAKIRVYRPINPVLNTGGERWDGSRVYMRDGVETWVKQRAQRKALGKLYGKYLSNLYKPMGRFPWADVLADVEATGLRIDSYNSWQRVRTRVAHKGLSLPAYLKSLWTFAGLARKPWDLRPCNVTERIESYRSARQDYFTTMREVQFIRDQITNAKACAEPLALELAKAS
jgi:hypothetical protein